MKGSFSSSRIFFFGFFNTHTHTQKERKKERKKGVPTRVILEEKFKNKALDESTLFQTHEKRLTSFDRRRARFDSRPGFRRRRYSYSRRVNSRAPLLLVSSNVQLFSNCVVSLESQLRVNAFTARYESVVQTPPPPPPPRGRRRITQQQLFSATREPRLRLLVDLLFRDE